MRARRGRTRRRRVDKRRWERIVDARWRRALVGAAWATVVVAVLAAVNAVYQAARKPTEILGVVAPTAPKTPEATWDAYGESFREHSTDVVRAELLAALAQAESGGDPLARTYWRWRWSWNPLELYAPASSAVGLLQITDGTFAEARRLCIKDHALAREGGWLEPGACRLNALYFRTVPDHAVELTAAFLHASIVETLGPARLSRTTAAQRGRLAAVIHLCGRARGAVFAARGFRARPGERCGEHDLAAYLARVGELEVVFALLAAAR